MNDHTTLLNFINFLIIREMRGGSNALLLEHLKYIESGIDGHIQATPELASFLWNKCVEISRIFPNSMKLISCEPHFSQDLKSVIGNHEIARQSTVADPVVEAITELVTETDHRLSLSDVSWLKTGLNRYLKSNIQELDHRALSCYLFHPIEIYLPQLGVWRDKGWLSMQCVDLNHPNKLCLKMHSYIDFEEPLYP